VIGTGPRGIAACRTLSEWGVAFDCFEELDSVAASLFAAEVENRVGLCDREADDGCPQACVIAEALESYVTRFGLRPKIVFGRGVEYVLQLPDGRWRVHFERGPASLYDAVLVAASDRHPLPARAHADPLVPESLPFFDPEERAVLRDDLPLWKHLIHPRYRNLFFLARLKTARLTLRIAEEQSQFAAGFITGSYRLPTRWQMERERRAIPLRACEPGRETRDCPDSASDTRYAFHLRSERARRAREDDAVVERIRMRGALPCYSALPRVRETAGS
jgi:hypothetical protein